MKPFDCSLLPLCTPSPSSCSGLLIIKTEMLCQRYCTHAIPFTFLLHLSNHTHTNRNGSGMHIRQLIQLETLTPVLSSAAARRDNFFWGVEGLRGLAVGLAATVFLIDDLCWIDTFCKGLRNMHAAFPLWRERMAFVN